jgi:PAS domain S-box-containing protein/diguanylate cyclase (GGDEF)-like protein
VGEVSAELLQDIVAATTNALLVVDAATGDGEIVYANPAYEERSGYSLNELVGSPWLEQAVADDDAPDLARLKRSMRGDEAVRMSLPFLRKDGDIWLARFVLTPLGAGAPEHRYLLVQHETDDAAAAKSSNAELLKRALGSARRKSTSFDRTDQVTGLLSLEHFRVLLRRELAVARRSEQPLCLMVFVVPELGIYRRTFGASAADSCLRMVGAQITGTFRRASDLCARFGEASLAVAVRGLEEEQADRLIGVVEDKVKSLALHNPRGRQGRHILVNGSCLMAAPSTEGVELLTARAAVLVQESERQSEHAGT